MLAGNWKTGLRSVIKFQSRLPRQIAVTGCTILEGRIQLLSNFLAVAMIVSMTTPAGLLRNFEIEVWQRLTLVALVTIHALNLSMFALQFKSGYVVLEVRQFPISLRLGVTFEAITPFETRRKVVAVLILVASQTFLGR